MKHRKKFFILLLMTLSTSALLFIGFSLLRNYHLESAPLSNEEVLAYFAGNYTRIEGMASSNLIIDPHQTFSFVVHTDILYDFTFNGTTEISQGEIQLIPEEYTELLFTSGHLIPIRWGKRKYLIEADDVSDFCNEILNDKEPLPSGRSWYFHIFPKNSIPSSASYPILPNGKPLCQ